MFSNYIVWLHVQQLFEIQTPDWIRDGGPQNINFIANTMWLLLQVSKGGVVFGLHSISKLFTRSRCLLVYLAFLFECTIWYAIGNNATFSREQVHS